MRLVFFGDSLTWGGFGGNWVDVVAQRMPEHLVINAGVGGDTVYNLYHRAQPMLEQHQPEAVFVMVGGNDAVSYTMPDTRVYYKSSKGIPDGMITPEQFGTLYRDLLVLLRLNYVQVMVGLPPTEYNRELVQARHQYNQVAQTVAESLGIATLDLATPYIPAQPIEREAVNLRFIQDIGRRYANQWQDFEAERAKWGYRYTFDGMHLMPETAPQFADYIVPFLQAHLS